MVRQRPLRLEIATPPSEEELERAIGKLKCGKAGGDSFRDGEGSMQQRGLHEDVEGRCMEAG